MSADDAPAPGTTRAPDARRRRWGRTLAAAVLVALALGLGAAGWLLGTQSGLDAVLGLARRAAPGALQVEGAEGRLLGPLRIAALRYHTADLHVDVRGFALDWQPRALLERRLVVDRLAAASVELARRGDPASAAPVLPPETLELPMALAVARLELDAFVLRELDVGGGGREATAGAPRDAGGAALDPQSAGAAVRDPPPMADAVGEAAAQGFRFAALRAALRSDGRQHRVDELALELPQGRISFHGTLDGASPFPLEAGGRFAGAFDGRSFAAQFAAGDTLHRPRLVVDAEGEGLRAHADIVAAPFEPVPLRALRLQAGELDPAAFVAGAPRAALALEAELAAPADGGALLAGPLRIVNRSPAPVDGGGIPVHSLAGALAWTEEEIGVDALDIVLPGEGRISGRLAWRPPGGADASEPDAATEPDSAPETGAGSGFGQILAALELAAIDTRTLDTRLPRQFVAGRLDAEADARRQQATLALTVGAARIDAHGELLVGEAQAARRFSVQGKLRGVDPRALVPAAPTARLNLDLEASGALPAAGLPQAAQLEFRIPDSRIEQLPLAGEGRLRVEGARLPEVSLALRLAGNSLSAEGAWGGRGDTLALRLDAPALAALGHGLAGRAGAEGSLGGTPAAPAGQLQFFGEALRLPGAVSLLGVNGLVRVDAGADGPFRLAVGLSGLGPTGADKDGVALPDWIDSARLSAEGTRKHHRIELSAVAPERDEVADRLDLLLQGGLADGAAGREGPRWVGELARLQSAGRFAARLLAPARLELAADAMRLGAAELAAGEQGRIRLLETAWSPAQSVARGSLTGLAFGPVSRPDGRPRRGPGPLMLGGEWDLRVGSTLEGQARVFREAGDLTIEGEIRTRLGLEHLEAALAARGDRLSLSVTARGSEFGTLEGAAALRAERAANGRWGISPQAPLSGSARLDMPSLTWLGRLMRENVETAGRVGGAFTLGGTVEAPLASGRVEGRELQLALLDQGLVLSGGEFDLSFDRDRLRLERVAFVSPNRVRPPDNRIPFAELTATPGTLTASGELALDTGAGDFRFAAERLPLLQREDRWMILSGRGSARSTWTSLALDADFRADAGYLAFAETVPPSLSDDVVVLGRDQRKEGGFALSADVRVSLGDALYLSALGLDTRLAGELRLRQQPGLPLSAVGTVSTVGGSYRGYGQNLVIDRGTVNFQGPLDAPGLNVVALRKGLAVEAGVAVTGSAKRPQVRLVSEPNVPDPEKLSWIVLGRAPDAGAGADLGLLLPAAQALLGGPGGGMTEELSRSLGFDTFSIGQGELNSTTRAATSRVVGGGSTIAGGPSVSGQVLSVGKRLGADLFLSFEQSLGGAETLVKLTYQLSRRVSLIARGGTDNALDLHYGFSFR